MALTGVLRSRLRAVRVPQGEQAVLATLLCGGLALTALSLRLLWATPHPLANLTLTSGATSLFLMGLLAEDVPAVHRAATRMFSTFASLFDVSPFQAVILLFGLHLSLASWSASGGGVVTHVPEGVALWVLGILLTVLALWKPSPKATRPQPARRQLIPWALILFVAIALRIFAIGDAPAAISGDEGSVGLVGWEFVSGQRNNLFQTAWHSLPTLYFGLVSLSQRLFGRTLEAIRLTSVLGGTLSIVATYWAAGKLFGRRSALLSAAFLAVYHVHLLFSRIATASVWDGVFFSAVLGGLWMGAAKGERAGFLLAGLAAGLAHYFHPISRLILVYALAWALLLLARNRGERSHAGPYAGGLVALVTLLPLVLYFFATPSEYFAPFRAGLVTGDLPLLTAISETPTTALGLLASQLRASVLGIILAPLRGVYTPGTALLLPLPAALFVIGLSLSILRIRDPRLAALLISLAGPLIIGAISIEAPNVELLQAVTPAAAMLIAFPLDEGLTQVRRLAVKARTAALALVTGMMILMALLEMRQTLSERTPFAGYAGPTAALAWQMGNSLAGIPRGTPVYLFGWPTIAFDWEPGLFYLAAGFETHDVIWPLETGQSLPAPGTPAVFLFAQEQMGAIEEVRRRYPEARVFLHTDPRSGLRFASMEVGL